MNCVCLYDRKQHSNKKEQTTNTLENMEKLKNIKSNERRKIRRVNNV